MFPASVVTRPVEVGVTLSVVDGERLEIEAVTVASRALVHVTTGTRLEKTTSVKFSPLAGESLWWQTACTDRSGEYVDPDDDNKLIVLGPDEHTHTLTTTITVTRGGVQVAERVIGPYTVPTPEDAFERLDLDLVQVTGTTPGVAVPIPEAWTQTVAAAEQAALDVEAGLAELAPSLTDIADLKTKTTTGYLSPAGLSATFVRFVDQNGDLLPAGSVTTIHVNTTTGDIDDITFEEA